MQLSKSLSIICVSTLLISGSGYALLRAYKHKLNHRLSNPDYLINLIVQTGPEKNALPTNYLAELLNLSVDQPTNLYQFSPADAKEALLASPLIKTAHVKPIKPSAIYIDYTVRKPIAKLSSHQNTGIDCEGYLFPLSPHLTPKNLPELALPNIPEEISWGKKIDLAITRDIFALLTQPKLFDIFTIKRLDLSQINASSAGRREIALIIEDQGTPRTLRLSPKSYAQNLGNYLELRTTLDPETSHIIDFRIDGTAYISSL